MEPELIEVLQSIDTHLFAIKWNIIIIFVIFVIQDIIKKR